MKGMKGGCVGHKISWLLVVIGALNWGLYGAFQFNLVNKILGSWSMVERVVYVLVGIAGLMMIFGCRCKRCMAACNCAPEKKM